MRLIRSLLAALAVACALCGALCAYAAFAEYSTQPTPSPNLREDWGGLAQVNKIPPGAAQGYFF